MNVHQESKSALNKIRTSTSPSSKDSTVDHCFVGEMAYRVTLGAGSQEV